MEPLGGDRVGDIDGVTTPAALCSRFWCLAEDVEDGSLGDSLDASKISPEVYRRRSPEVTSSQSLRPEGTVSAGGSGLSNGQGVQQLQHSRFEAGGSSSQGGREGDWRRDDGFANQGFGGFDEGYYEGHNGFNGGGNRYQRRFNNTENPPPNLNAQVTNATKLVALASVGSDASLGSQMTASSAENVVNNLSARAQKKIDKVQCLRCGEYGHFADACNATLSLYCEKTSHESKDCPLHAMPKPVAITYGVSRNGLMFLEVPASSEVTFKYDSGKLGKISVTGGNLSAEQIVNELEWIIPCSLIGKTKEVDMAFTRTHSMARMLVEVTRVELIPTTTVDHTYDGEGYGLIFKVEGEQLNDKPDVHMQDAHAPEDSKDGEGKGKDDKTTDPKSGPAKSTLDVNPTLPKANNVPAMQAQNLSLPVLRVGQIDYYDSVHSKLVSRSENKVLKIVPRRLWGDSALEDDDSLPSPLPRLVMESDVEVSVQVAPQAENSEVVVAAVEESGVLLPAAGSPAEFAPAAENLDVFLPAAGSDDVCVSTAKDEIGVHATEDCGVLRPAAGSPTPAVEILDVCSTASAFVAKDMAVSLPAAGNSAKSS
ncbi:hypothetical protein ACQ4PT_041749 [Festuca glaucescens]